MPIKIVVDSACDLPQGTREQYDITVTPNYINLGDRSLLDGVDISREEFYQQLPHFKQFPTTAAPGPDQFLQTYETLADQGADGIISIHVSSKLSAIYNSARLGAKDFHRCPIRVVDSNQLSAGAGLIAVRAAQAAADGASMDEILALINDLIPRAYTFAVLDTLDYLQHSGRMGQVIMTVGNLLHIQAVLKMNHGKPGAERIRTTNKGIARLVELIETLQPFEDFHYVHTDSQKNLARFKEGAEPLLDESLNPQTIIVGPTLGSHLGPGALGFSCITKNYPEPSALERSVKRVMDTARKIKEVKIPGWPRDSRPDDPN